MRKKIIIFFLISFGLSSAGLSRPPAAKIQGPPGQENMIKMEYDWLSSGDFSQHRWQGTALVKIAEIHDIAILSRFRAEYMQNRDDQYFPGDLFNLGMGVRVRSRNIMGEAGINSRSDRPFNSMDEVSAVFYGFYRVLKMPRGGLYAGVIYFPFEQLIPEEYVSWNTPVPMVMYMYASREFFLLAGIPFILRWKIGRQITYDFRYIPVTNIRSSMVFGFNKFVAAGPEFRWRERNYLIAGRDNRREKLYHESMAAGLKLSAAVFFKTRLELFCGYSPWDRYYTGESYSDVNNRVSTGEGMLFSAALNGRF